MSADTSAAAPRPDATVGADRAEPPAQPDAPAPAVTSAHRKQVLIVDDDSLNRKLASIRLEDAGFAVVTAESAEDALRIAAASPPDAILSDIRMTGMTGFELSAAIRRDARLAHIPVILLSASEPVASSHADHDPTCLVRTADFREAIDAVRAAVHGAE
jgi:CheY-like chemotaxis protein